jgi:hypothetical protein
MQLNDVVGNPSVDIAHHIYQIDRGNSVETGGTFHLHNLAESKGSKASGKTSTALWKKLAVVAAAVLVVSQFYYFRELAAALLIFTILFLIFAAIVGAIYLIGRASQKGFSIAEPAARRGLVFAEAISRKTFHRQRSVPVP